MNGQKLKLTRQQFLVTAGLAGVATCVAGCAGYGQSPASPGANTAAAQTVPPPADGAVPITATADVPLGSGVIVDDVVVTQPTAGVFRAFSAVCTHAGCTLAEVSDGTINCPCHGSKFNLDGTVANGPAARPLERKTVTVNGDVIVAS